MADNKPKPDVIVSRHRTTHYWTDINGKRHEYYVWHKREQPKPKA